MFMAENKIVKKRKGGVTLQQVNEAIETLLDYDAREFTFEQRQLAVGMGFILIADGKGTKTAQSEDVQAGLAQAMAEGLGALTDEMRAEIPEDGVQAIALAVSFSCHPALRMIAHEYMHRQEAEDDREDAREMDKIPDYETFLEAIADRVASKLKSNQ